MQYYLSSVSHLDTSYLDVNNLFKDNNGELYSFKIDSDRESGIVIRDTVGRSMPIDWSDVPEFTKTFILLNAKVAANEYNFNN